MRILAVLATLSLAATGALAQSPEALSTYNAQVQETWGRLLGGVRGRIDAEARQALLAVDQTSGAVRIQVTGVNAIDVGVDRAPGFSEISLDRLAMRLPGDGGWRLVADVDLRVTIQTPWFPIVLTPRVTAEVADLQAGIVVRLNSIDPERPLVAEVEPPEVSFRVTLGSPNAIYDAVFRVLNPVLNVLARVAVIVAVGEVSGMLDGIEGFPGAIPGDAAPYLADNGAATPFMDHALAIERKVMRVNMPYDTLVHARFSAPCERRWEECCRSGAVCPGGQVVGYESYGDSAIWTGHLLAGQAFRRIQFPRDRVGLAFLRRTLRGCTNLLDVFGGTGLLARCAAPLDTPLGQQMDRDNGRRGLLRGRWYVGVSGGNGISRDQYSGQFFGQAIAYDFARLPDVRRTTRRNLTTMLDYIISTGWFIDEDRSAFPDSMPTFWTGVVNQQITFLLIGERIAPGRYAAELARWSPLAELNWLGAWLSTFNLDSYYKFNLGEITDLNYFRLETDPVRYQRMFRAYRITRRYIDKHVNPHFDTIGIRVEPRTRAALAPQVRQSLREFLTRCHRAMAPRDLRTDDIQWVPYTMFVVNADDRRIERQDVLMPSRAVDVRRRPPADFLWQRSAFGVATAGEGDPLEETPGVDYTLPYWMARWFGVFRR